MAKSLKKRSLSLILSSGLTSVVLALGLTPTLGAFSALISGAANAAGTGTIVMQEVDSSGTVTCLSTDGGGLALNVASCPGINRFGGGVGMQPGDHATIVTDIRNVGTVAAASFSLNPGPCVQSAIGNIAGAAKDFCSRISVSITSGSSTIFSGSAAALGGTGTIDILSHLGLAKVAPGQQTPITVTTIMDPAADNSYQGLMVSQPMTWTFSA